MNDLFSNIVDKKNLRHVQEMTLDKISETLSHTAGPYGSNTIILGDPGKGESDIYTKDGHKVLCSIDFFNPLEKSIQMQLKEITEYIVHTVGDGTTSTVMMCASIFKELNNYLEVSNTPMFKVIDEFCKAIDEIQDLIRSHGREIELVDIYDICMISTNGNKEISTQIADIYQQHGKNVHINVGISNDTDHKIKSYNGLTLERGYSSPAFINVSDGDNSGRCVIHNPNIYTFKDPVDTPELIGYLQQIIVSNIMRPIYDRKPDQIVPTVIMAPSISRDANAFLQELEKMLYSMTPETKPPILIISGLNEYVDQYFDITMLCGCKTINKYIDPKVQEKDIADGKAPSMDNITEWCGHCEEIVADNMSTKFTNPADMYEYDDEGNYKESSTYEGLLRFVEQELELSIKNNESIGVIGNLRRRLNSLKCNLVDYFIGGISSIDRDSVKDLVEDAVLNCRSACNNGVGYGSNFEGFRATRELIDKEDHKGIRQEMLSIINKAYIDVLLNLYMLNFDGDANDLIEENLKNGRPLNLRTLSWVDEQVLCSIDCDIAILDCIKKVIVPMVTANQTLLLNPQHNKYLE